MKKNGVFFAAASVLTALLLLIPAGATRAETLWQPATRCEHFPACFQGESSCPGFIPFYEVNNVTVDSMKTWSIDASKIVNGQFIGFGIYGLDLSSVDNLGVAKIRLRNSAGEYIGLQATRTENGANLLVEQSALNNPASSSSENVTYDKLDLRLEFTRDTDEDGWRVQFFSRPAVTGEWADWDFLYRVDCDHPINFDTASIVAEPASAGNAYTFAKIQLCRYLWIDVWSGGERPGDGFQTPAAGGPGMVEYGANVFVYTGPDPSVEEMDNLVFQGWYQGHWSAGTLLSRDYVYAFQAVGPANLTLCANWKYVNGAASIMQESEEASGTLSYNYESWPRVELEFSGAEDPGSISVTRYGSDDHNKPPGADAAGIYLSIGRMGLEGAGFTIKAYYDPADLPAGMEEEELKLYRLNPDSGAWALLSEQGVNIAQHFVWAKLTGFSTFGIFAPSAAAQEPVPGSGPVPGPKSGGKPGSETRSGLLSHTDGALPVLPFAGALLIAGTTVLVLQRRLRSQR